MQMQPKAQHFKSSYMYVSTFITCLDLGSILLTALVLSCFRFPKSVKVAKSETDCCLDRELEAATQSLRQCVRTAGLK
jgi:hypothetical protein